MFKSIAEYDQAISDTLDKGYIVLEKIKFESLAIPSTERDLHNINFDNIIFKLEKVISDLEKQKVKYKFDRMDKEEFNKVLQNVLEGKKTTLITVGKEHKLTDYDTLQSLYDQYNINIDDILNYNKISTEEFNDKKTRGENILIPLIIDLKSSAVYSQLPVFGSIDGIKALGTDATNELVVDNGDLKIIDGTDCLIQGLINRYGSYGDIPGYESNTIDLDWGSDYNSTMIDLLTLIKVKSRLLRDKRVSEINDVIINSQYNGKIVTVNLNAINTFGNIKVEKEKLTENLGNN
jgi:hypothetical protein